MLRRGDSCAQLIRAKLLQLNELLAQLQLEGQARRARPSPASSASSVPMTYWFQFVTSRQLHSLNRCDVRFAWRPIIATAAMAACSELAAGRVRQRSCDQLPRPVTSLKVGTSYYRCGRNRQNIRAGQSINRRALKIDRSCAVRAGIRRSRIGGRRQIAITGVGDQRRILRLPVATVRPAPEIIHGPYSDETKARMEWQRLTFKDRHAATERYSICVEPDRYSSDAKGYWRARSSAESLPNHPVSVGR